VLTGEAKIRFVTFDSEVLVFEHVQASRLFGFASFANRSRSTYGAIPSRSTRLVVFGPVAYAVLVDQVPGAARQLLRGLALRPLAPCDCSKRRAT
jgi:hypothetical protein